MAPKPQPLEEGTKAPAFKSKTYTGEEIKLSDFKGQHLLLYFYPKDNTPGCTTQAQNLQTNLKKLSAQKIAIVGVSPDDNDSHQRFSEKHQLAFPLLPDPDRKIIEKYGVWGEKKNYGKVYMGLQRTSFLINDSGIIQHVFKRPKTNEHTEEILTWLKANT